jgi:hypothetical protein
MDCIVPEKRRPDGGLDRRDTMLFFGSVMRCSFVLLLLVPAAFAQSTEVGFVAGGGGMARLFDNSAYHFVAGAEGCVWCGGHLGLFMQYHHWSRTSSGTDDPRSLDLVAAGARIQGTGQRVRPFLELGFTAGGERNGRGFANGPDQARAVAGGVLGAGAAISITDHWYVRPMVRIIGLSSPELGGFAAAGVGYRF